MASSSIRLVTYRFAHGNKDICNGVHYASVSAKWISPHSSFCVAFVVINHHHALYKTKGHKRAFEFKATHTIFNDKKIKSLPCIYSYNKGYQSLNNVYLCLYKGYVTYPCRDVSYWVNGNLLTFNQDGLTSPFHV